MPSVPTAYKIKPLPSVLRYGILPSFAEVWVGRQLRYSAYYKYKAFVLKSNGFIVMFQYEPVRVTVRGEVLFL